MKFTVISSEKSQAPGFENAFRTKLKTTFTKTDPVLGEMVSSAVFTFKGLKQHTVGAVLELNPSNYVVKESYYQPDITKPGIKQLHLHPKGE